MKDNCPTALTSTTVHTGLSPTKNSISYTIFEFRNPSSPGKLNLACVARVCDASDQNSTCKRGCVPVTTPAPVTTTPAPAQAAAAPATPPTYANLEHVGTTTNAYWYRSEKNIGWDAADSLCRGAGNSVKLAQFKDSEEVQEGARIVQGVYDDWMWMQGSNDADGNYVYDDGTPLISTFESGLKWFRADMGMSTNNNPRVKPLFSGYSLLLGQREVTFRSLDKDNFTNLYALCRHERS